MWKSSKCKCCAQYSSNNLQMMIWNPFKIAVSISYPKFLYIEQQRISLNQINSKLAESSFIFGKEYHHWAKMHRIFSQLVTKLLSVVKGFNYLHIEHLKGGINANKKWVIVAGYTWKQLISFSRFLFKTKLHKTSHRLPLYGQDWINFMCINELLRWL